MIISDLMVVHKEGGKSGDWMRSEGSSHEEDYDL